MSVLRCLPVLSEGVDRSSVINDEYWIDRSGIAARQQQLLPGVVLPPEHASPPQHSSSPRQPSPPPPPSDHRAPSRTPRYHAVHFMTIINGRTQPQQLQQQQHHQQHHIANNNNCYYNFYCYYYYYNYYYYCYYTGYALMDLHSRLSVSGQFHQSQVSEIFSILFVFFLFLIWNSEVNAILNHFLPSSPSSPPTQLPSGKFGDLSIPCEKFAEIRWVWDSTSSDRLKNRWFVPRPTPLLRQLSTPTHPPANRKLHDFRSNRQSSAVSKNFRALRQSWNYRDKRNEIGSW